MALAPRRVKSNDVFGSVTQTIVMECDVSAAVGDLVRQDQAINNKIEVATDNSKPYQVIGKINKKNSDTEAEVILRGVIDTALTTKGRTYLSATGTVTTTAPSADYLQVLGYSFGNGKLHFEPNTITTLQS